MLLLDKEHEQLECLDRLANFGKPVTRDYGYGFFTGLNSRTRTRTRGKTRGKPAGYPYPCNTLGSAEKF